MNNRRIKILLIKSLPLICILVGIIIVLVSIVTFTNGDTQWEFEAVLGVIKWGKPYVITQGNMINQPPLGFYTEAIFFRIFGVTLENGVVLVTLFGLGCIILVYGIGNLLYGKLTGLLAAAIFALTPWFVILSRSFLIDTQCLFLSLFSIFLGILALQKDSIKLFIVSGIFFAAAFLTKFYAIFSLIPIFLLYVYYESNDRKNKGRYLGAFLIPSILSVFLWYQFISGQGLGSLFQHKDFINLNPSYIEPSIFFVGNFVLNYGLGGFLTLATIFSFAICIFYRKLFSKICLFDLICLITIISVVVINTALGVILNLKAPYYNVVKYAYQALPFFSLLAATLLIKCFLIFNLIKSSTKILRFIHAFILSIGIILLAGSILSNIYRLHVISMWPSILFRFDMNLDAGYFFFHNNPIEIYHPLLKLQCFGFMLVLSGLIIGSIDKIKIFLNIVIAKIKPKHAISVELLKDKTNKT